MKKLVWKTVIVDIMYDIAGSILYAAGLYTFASNADFAPGGVSGIAVIINHFTGWPIGVLTLVLNIPIVLFSLRFLGRQFFAKSVKTMIIGALFIDLVFPLFPRYAGDPLLAALFGGALVGAGLGLIYMRGSSTGGTDFLTFTFKKLWPHLSVGDITASIDGLVIVAGALVFRRVDAALYGAVMTFAGTFFIDKILNGSTVGKLAFIVTDFPEEAVRAIDAAVNRGCTVFDGRGGYRGDLRHMIVCACSRTEIVKLRRAAYEVDPKAFIMITDYSETFGEGFKDHEST